MAEALIEKLRPLWDAAERAFRSDPSYAIEMAQAGSAQRASRVATAVNLEFSGV